MRIASMPEPEDFTPQRWAELGLPKQLITIGGEMHVASSTFAFESAPVWRSAYARVMQLVDLTVEVNDRPSLRREILLFRSLIERLMQLDEPDPSTHHAAHRCLLYLHPESARHVRTLGI